MQMVKTEQIYHKYEQLKMHICEYIIMIRHFHNIGELIKIYLAIINRKQEVTHAQQILNITTWQWATPGNHPGMLTPLLNPQQNCYLYISGGYPFLRQNYWKLQSLDKQVTIQQSQCSVHLANLPINILSTFYFFQQYYHTCQPHQVTFYCTSSRCRTPVS